MALDKLNSRRYRAHREKVFKVHGHVCAYCGTDEGQMHIDHIIPRKVGGDHNMENLQVLCKSCNLRKAARSEGVFLSKAATPPVFSEHIYPMKSEPMLDSPFTVRPNPNQ
jgi:5-methylcytosine-specific restriction endonuclease McrA